jgi:hypothetical protein
VRNIPFFASTELLAKTNSSNICVVGLPHEQSGLRLPERLDTFWEHLIDMRPQFLPEARVFEFVLIWEAGATERTVTLPTRDIDAMGESSLSRQDGKMKLKILVSIQGMTSLPQAGFKGRGTT